MTDEIATAITAAIDAKCDEDSMNYGHRSPSPRLLPRRTMALLRATEQPIDTGTAAGKCFLDMLGVFAEFETNLRRERQLEGIADAKARGVYRGRKASIDPAKVTEMRAQGMGASAIAKALKIGRASVYRALEA
jgi:DNA invertase Pin-like site-specific DNA recombinase